jgi:multidrug efflux pump subunit AcrA (membrane-fusion protein)
VLQAKTEQSQAQIQAQRAQLVTADAELAVERAARRAQEANLAALQAQAGQLRDRLAFYDQLLPAGPAGTISIRAVEATRVSAGLRYRVLLMRSARPGLAPFTGALQFVAEGTLDGAEVRIALMPLQAAPAQEVASGNLVPADTVPANPDSFGKPVRRVASDPVASDPVAAVATPSTGASLVPLEVDQYRSTEGILALPDGFVPAIVSVDVLRDGVVLASQQTAVAF